MSVPSWSDLDVETAAQCVMDGTIPPLELMARMGPTPPPEYLEAFGQRVIEKSLQQGMAPKRLPLALQCSICKNMVDRDGDCIVECEHTADVQAAYRRGEF